MILVEAMACALPVIAVRAGAVTEIVDAQVGRIATPDDVRSLADAVRSIFAGDRDAMGAFARARAERDYLWQNSLPRLLRRYAELIRARAPARDAMREDAHERARDELAGTNLIDPNEGLVRDGTPPRDEVPEAA